MNKKKGSGRGVGLYIMFFIVLLVTISVLMGPGQEAPAATYTDVRQAILEEQATELILGENQILLELRYLCFKSWEQIAVLMNYNCNYVFDLHKRALKAVVVPQTSEEN